MIAFYFLIAALAFFVLYLSVNKLTKKIDEEGEAFLMPSLSYDGFCDAIIEELDILIDLINKDKIESKNKANSLEELDNFKRQLKYTKSINISKGTESWQEALTKYLLKIDDFLKTNLNKGEEIADLLRNNLGEKFKKL